MDSEGECRLVKVVQVNEILPSLGPDSARCRDYQRT